jgi:molecular chaperone HscB
MICWSCQKAAGDEMLCAHCNAVQPPNPKADYFSLFGISRAFAVDADELEHRYKEMTRVLHPDRFARADAQARRASLERSVQLNEAWRTLKDPVRRAEYLLSLHGIDIGDMAGRGRQEKPGERATLPVPQVLLMEVLELREALADAYAAKDTHKTGALIAKVRDRLGAVMDDVAQGFAASPPELSAIAVHLVTMRYYRRFLDEASMLWEEGSARTGESGSRAG